MRPKLTHTEIEMAGKAIGFELATMEMAPPVEPILNELLHSTAYRGISSLGLARYCPKENINKITRDHIMQFMTSLYRQVMRFPHFICRYHLLLSVALVEMQSF